MDQPSGSFSCIAVDMGASSIRIMLGTLDSRGLSHLEVHRMANGTLFFEGHDRWDMGLIVQEITRGLEKAWKLSGGAATSIGIDSWGVDFVLLDAQGKLTDQPVAYRDKRTEGMQGEWKKMMPEMETFRRTGINFYLFNTLFQMLALKDSEEIGRTTSILFLPCYISYLLTGEARNELTIASTSQMLAVEGDRWDPEILQMLEVKEEQLGRIVNPGTRLGKIRIPGLEETELTGVAVCGHDTACVVAAIPVEHPDYVYISAGTWCIVGIESGAPLISEDAFKAGLTNERGYGNTYRVLKNIVGLWLLQGLKEELHEGSTFGEMELMALEGGDTRQLIDPEDPLFYNPRHMKQAFDKYFKETDQDLPETIGDYIRCAYHSLCYSFRYHIELLEKLSDRSIQVIHLVGGGSQSDYLNQHIATICNRNVSAGPVEGAAIGNILIQAIAMGKLKSLEEGRSLVRESYPIKRYAPAPASDFIREQYEKFISIKA
jgi:rhamnulokinase